MIGYNARAARGHIRSITTFRLPALSKLAYNVPGSRDLRIDFLRGFLVLAMVVDHLGGDSLINSITGNNQFLTSAAEGFVFVSGFLMGIVYGKRLIRQGLGGMLVAVLRRTLFLYVTVTALTLGFVALFLFTSIPLWFDRSYGLGVDGPLAAVREALRLHYTYNGTDILLTYVLLVGLTPLAFGLTWLGGKAARRLGGNAGRRIAGLVGGPLPLLVTSWGIWAFYEFFADRKTLHWPFDDSLSFPLLAWQALFFSGLALGYHRERLGGIKRLIRSVPALLGVGVAFVGLLAISRAHLSGALASYHLPLFPSIVIDEPTFHTLFDKASLGPGRVIAFLLVAVLATQLTTMFWRPLRFLFGWLLLPLGQSALLVYSFHLFLLGPARDYLGFVLFANPASPLASTLAQAAVILGILVALRLRKPIADLRHASLEALRLAAGAVTMPLAQAVVRVPSGSGRGHR